MRAIARIAWGVVFVAASFGCGPQPNASSPSGGDEEIVPLQTQAIPAQKAWELKVGVNRPGQIDIHWDIEAGKSVNILVLTEEQEQRAQAGTPPTQPGKDFVQMTMGVSGAGNDVEKVQAGVYYVVFENPATDGDVTVKASISGHGS